MTVELYVSYVMNLNIYGHLPSNEIRGVVIILQDAHVLHGRNKERVEKNNRRWRRKVVL